MAHCPSCGGVIGRDCFNTQECATIAEQMNQPVDNITIIALKTAMEAIEFADKEFDCPRPLVETWGNMYMNALAQIEQALNNAGISVQKTPVHSNTDDLPF